MMIFPTDEDVKLGELECDKLYYVTCEWPRVSDYMAFAVWDDYVLVVYVYSHCGSLYYGIAGEGEYHYFAIREVRRELSLEDAYRQICKEVQKKDLGEVQSVGKLFAFNTSDNLNNVWERTPHDYILRAIKQDEIKG